MPFENLPGIFETKLDGSLAIPNTNDSPIVCVLGTSNQGDAENLFTAVRLTDAARVFGKTGTLVRGMYEAASTGATNIRLFRIGATSALLEDVGAGLDIETVAKDDSAGSDFKIWFTASSGRLRVYRAVDDTLVFDSGDGVDPDTKVDLGEVVVTGTATAGSNIGTSLATAVLLEDAPGVDAGTTFTAGTDGIDLTRMELYEALDRAYALLEDADIDVVVPMNAYLDDLNVMDMTSAAASGLTTGVTSFGDITIGGANDLLGLLYTEEFDGVLHYFWDIDRDGVAEIVPTVRGLTGPQQTSLDAGNISIAAVVAGDPADLTINNFHEVNFAYQLANFCYKSSHLNTEMHGSIGVLPPAAFSPREVALWVGSAPVTEVDGNGEEQIVTNGRGLLGNKWVAGRIAVGTLPAHLIDGEAKVDGGFIATDDGTINGVQLKDENDHLVDIGKYLDIVAAYVQQVNPSRTTAYVASAAAAYAGLVTTLPASSAPTNKVISNVSLPFRINNSKLDALAGKRYVAFVDKPKGTVVADAPSGARPESDYNRRSTMRIVKATIDVVRQVGEPFLGEGMSGAQLAALETAIMQNLSDLVKAKPQVLVRFEVKVSATALERVQGKCKVELLLVPAFELRQINVTVALAAA
jgi:hypothetical protein